MMMRGLFIFLAVSLTSVAQDKEQFAGSSLAVECRNNQEFFSSHFNISCHNNFHYYQSKTKTKLDNTSTVKIAEFNALHPGMNKTRFKDYKKLAQIIQEFDIVAVTELIPLMSLDLENNEEVLQFLEDAPEMIKATKSEIATLQRQLRSSSRGRTAKERELRLLKRKKEQLEDDLDDAASLYREPGYLRILKELHKLRGGKSWNLILSPRGEGSELTSTPELVGYFYRATKVQPAQNPYCKSVNKSANKFSYACIVNMDRIDLGTDKSSVFARRPFLAQFKAGKSNFTLLASHILFESPEEPSRIKEIMRAAFGVDSYEDLGVGINKANYARFAEVKITLDFIAKYSKRYPRYKNIIYLGDLNLRSSNKFWPRVLPSWPGAKLYIEEPTSLNENFARGDGTPTDGVSSNYDHFIFNPSLTRQCVNKRKEINGGAFNFMQGRIGTGIDRIYKVRYKYNGGKSNIRINANKYDKVLARFVEPYFDGRENIVTIGRKYVTSGRFRKLSRGIIVDERETEEYGLLFQERIMDSQLEYETFYKFYEQLISDHLPIHMTCKVD